MTANLTGGFIQYLGEQAALPLRLVNPVKSPYLSCMGNAKVKLSNVLSIAPVDRSNNRNTPGSSIYVQVRERVETLIAGGVLKPGGQLPAERILAAQLGVSRHSLRQALSALRERGLVEIKHGSGCYLRSKQDDAADDLTDALIVGNGELPHIIEARYAIERLLAAFAARRRTAMDLALLQESLESLRGEIRAGRTGLESDRTFHDRVAIAAKSPVLRKTLLGLSKEINRMRVEALAQPRTSQAVVDGHQRIFDAIKAGDATAAATAMEDHILEAADTLLTSDLGQGSLALLAYDLPVWPRSR